MPNLDFSVTRTGTDESGLSIAARVKSAGEEMRGVIFKLVEQALLEGEAVAKAEAPWSVERPKDGIRIVDAISISQDDRPTPGGSGGGSQFGGSLHVDGELAPHLRYVFEGTGIKGEIPRGLIYPANGNVMVIKDGQKKSFIRWAEGQRAQQEWWNAAHRRVEEVLDRGVSEIKLDK